jgi:pimeloyl-ACP methyl ester carboxylesterase
VAGFAGGIGVLWLFAKATRAALSRRFGRPVRRVFEAAQVPPDAVDVRIVAEPGVILRGWMREPAAARRSGQPGPVALVIHGWGSSAADMVPVSQPLLDAGLRVLLLDARGHGRSGDVDVASMPSFAEDLRTALGWLRRQPGIDPDRIVLVGHSVGAGAALFVAADDHAIAAVVSVSSMAAPREFMAQRLRASLPDPLVPPALRYVEHIIGHRYVEFSPLSTIGRSAAPVLLIHGALDSTVSISDAERLHERSPDRSTLLVLPDADHADLGSVQEAEPSLLRFLREAGALPGRATGCGESADGDPPAREG